MKTLIFGGKVVNEGKVLTASVVVDNDTITDIIEGTDTPRGSYDQIVDATGCFVLPGVIDDHVHFRDPGLTQKADMQTESRAAAFGGVTSYLDMPNTKPQTTTIDALEAKYADAAKKSHVNYGFFIGATNDNIEEVCSVNPQHVPGIKLFMGSSTGNMLVDKRDVLKQLFANSPLPIMAHCEDTDIINRNMQLAKQKYGDDPAVEHHPEIRSEEACWESTRLAVELASETGARLHVAHLTTERELQLFGSDPKITAEAVIAHLFFCDDDYKTLGTRIKCNPAIKTRADRDALRRALSDGRIATVGTDHAPHLLSDKEGGCANAASGMPMVQFSLVAMLELVDEGVLSIERLVELMAHNPARLFEIAKRGFLRKGYKADIVLVKPQSPWTVDKDCIQSKCGWSPMEGHTFQWQVRTTMCNGHIIYNNGAFDNESRGEELRFRTAE
ncbi:dihydroorotase [uncultured Prevotella sp.]|uniref:dihydroorotase n=1 Tax=uncultured Prevotella sp. TaxID=159272 RepID=UPI0027E36E3C|nr:dihydroorotase [uncultured Prevotella sp.]